MAKLPLRRNITIYGGSRFEFKFRAKDSTGAVIQMDGYLPEVVMLDEDGSEAVRLNTSNGGATIDATNDMVVVAIPADGTIAIPATAATYGLYLTPPIGGAPYRTQYYLGTVTVVKEGASG